MSLNAAAMAGDLWTVEYLYETKHDTNVAVSLANLVAERGHLEVLRYLCRHADCKYSGLGIQNALVRGHFLTVLWMLWHKKAHFVDMKIDPLSGEPV